MHQLGIAMEQSGMTVKALAAASGVSEGTITSIVNGTSPYKTNYTVAGCLENELGPGLFVKSEVSPYGRHAGTGRPLAASPFALAPWEVKCGSCYLVSPRMDECTNCGAPLAGTSPQG